ncbi:MAG: nucleotidyltransferase domain-containing protein [Candidatus Nanohaloarchaea archaeon]|nr:nucleotidyltransferase domain-containing protein [Candidatus Nanohaloarchaea archaeon]
METEQNKQPKTPERLEEMLGKCLEEFPLDLAFVFGSRADRSEDKYSDLDVAVKFKRDISKEDKLKLMDKITAEIIGETRIEKVDLLDLDNSDLEIAYNAVSEGKRVLGSEEQAQETKIRLQHLYWDFKPVKERWRNAMKERIEADTYGRP